MVITTTGTLVDGRIELDQPVDLPDRIAVSVTLKPIHPTTSPSKLAWEATKARLRERPIHGGGMPFRRGELYECD